MKKIAVLGLGKVGRLAAELLNEASFDVVGYDMRIPRAQVDFETRKVDVQDEAEVEKILAASDAVLSCLPYSLNQAVAILAHKLGIHYFDLTEDVPTTQKIIELSETATSLMAPQCGLAPGFVGIVGANLIEKFDDCRACRMRVGALPQHPAGLMAYAFNWSPEGVVNEYLNDCEVIEHGERKMVSSMEWRETIYIEGNRLEAFTTSGGLGTMCDTYLGRVDNLDYKSMRYPGHMDLMNFFFHELLMRDQRELAGEILVNAKPPVDDDVVYLHVSAEGHADGRLVRHEFVKAYKPIELAGQERRAIAWTTAGSVVAVIEMVRDGALPKGFLKQESIPLDAFLQTETGRHFAT